MKRKILKAALILLVALLAVLMVMALIPNHYVLPADKLRPDTKYWDLPTGSRIAYTMIPGKGVLKPSPVIYLHGGPGGPIFDRNIELLSALADEEYTVYLYDQVGCGFSERLEDISEYTAERHKQDLEAIVGILGCEKVILIGQSWGAILGTLYIADNPDKIEKAIFTGPGPIQPMRYELEKVPAPDSLELKQPLTTNRKEREKVYNFRAWAVEFCATTFGCKLAPDKEMDEFNTVLTTQLSKSTVSDTSRIKPAEGRSGYYCMVKTVQSFSTLPDIRPKIKQCTAPILLLRGQYDGIKWGYTTEYLSIFPNSTFKVIPNAGHSIATEQPEVYVNSIREFLRGE